MAAVHATPRYSGAAGAAVFTDLGVSWPLGHGVSAEGAIGHAHLSPRAGPDYYWQVGLSAEVRGFTRGLAYHGHDQDGCLSACDGCVALTLCEGILR